MTTVQNIPIDRLQPGQNDRTRFNQAELAELAESIRENGLIQPITVRLIGQTYHIVAGERRYRACKLLGWSSMPAIVKNLTDHQAARIMLAENVTRSDLDPIDEAQAYQKRMAQYKLSVAQMAQQAKVSETRVRDRLALLALDTQIQHLVRSGQFPKGHAVLLAPLDKNRQFIAVRFYNKTHCTKAELVEFAGKLESEQHQESLFDWGQFMAGPIAPDSSLVPPKRFRFRFTIVGIKFDLQIELNPLQRVSPFWAGFAEGFRS